MSDTRIWRVGDHYGIHIYAVNNGPDKDDDTPIATAATAALAVQIVREHNAARAAGLDRETRR